MTLHRTDVAPMVDHTLLKPEATPEDVAKLIAEAEALGAYSVCVSPAQLPLPRKTTVKTAVVCGFPSGAHHSLVKAAEAAQAVKDGADEIDMVVNLALVKSGDFDGVYRDIKAVRVAAPKPIVLKVIIESAVLTDLEIIAVCQMAEKAEADFVKTSTGFHPSGGASVAAVKLMKETVGERLEVKASGGIRDAKTALAMIAAGATRLGLSATEAVLAGLEAE